MAVRELSGPGGAPGPAVDCGKPGVLVWGAQDVEASARALRSVLAHTPDDVPVLVAGGDGTRAFLEGLDGREPWWVADGTWAAAAAAIAPGDLVVVHADAEVPAGWLGALRYAARDTGAASATALAPHAAWASVPARNLPWGLLPPDAELGAAAAAVRAASVRTRPRVPVPLGHCALLSRAALDLAGVPEPGGLTAWGARCTALGLVHVLADDLLVAHRGGGEAASGPPPDDATAAALADLAEDRFGPLSRSLLSVSRALRGPSVTVDARALRGTLNGTQVHVLELVGALARRAGDRAQLRVVVPDAPGPEAAAALATLGGAVELLPEGRIGEAGRTDVAHRPSQVATPQDLLDLDALGERSVITHQDLIGYRSPAVFADPDAWREHRRLTQEALAGAALVAFLSDAARDEAIAEDLVDPARARTVLIGTDHHLVAPVAPVAPAAAAARLEGRPFLVALGARFRHKGSAWAIELLRALRDEQGFDGALVLAGADVLHGSATGAEAATLAADPTLGEHVVQLGAVSEGEKAWLYAHAAAVLAPSTVEGFGLVPFEAAAAGTPCLWAPVSAHAELLGTEHAALVPWDASASAARVAAVLADPAATLAAAQDAGARLTWDATADGLLSVYEEAVRLPAAAVASLALVHAKAEADYWRERGGRESLEPARKILLGADALTEEDRLDIEWILPRPKRRQALTRFLRLTARSRGR